MEPTNFIQDFLLYNSGNECPHPYVIWTAYGLLSVASGHRVFMDINIDNHLVRTDLYILLVGESGGRKTATMLLGRDLLYEAISNVVFAADNETYQGVITTLANEDNNRTYFDAKGQEVTYSPYHIFAEELMDYLQLNPVAMVTFLTNIYGKKGYHYRLKNEEHFIPNTFVTMCACSTPEWLTAQIQSKQFSEGYGRRTVIVCHNGIIRRKPAYSDEAREAKKRCIARLQKIQQISGEAKLTSETDSFFWRWYEKLPNPDDKFMRNWYSTKHLNVLKVAMLNSLCVRDDLVVELPYVKLAISLIEEIERELPMITARLGRSEIVSPAADLVKLIVNHGGTIPEKELRMKTLKDFKDPMEQFRVLQFLVGTGQIAYVDQQINGVKKRLVIIPNK